MKSLAILLIALTITASANARVVTKTIEYKHKGVVLEGFLAWDDQLSGNGVPGVLVMHEWRGLNDYARTRTKQLAELGMVAFAADIYGKGNRATNRKQAAKFSSIYKKNRHLMRGRAVAALNVLRKNELVDKNKIACIGYCFGGTVSLELARSGADIAGVVSFHGGLETPYPHDAKNIKAKLLICHGAADPFVDAKEVAAFQKEMTDAKVDWQMILYSGAVHAFTNPANGNNPARGAAYNKAADKRSWQAMRTFFAEIFAQTNN